jgi:uncharacterized Rmd1/YagE family protein
MMQPKTHSLRSYAFSHSIDMMELARKYTSSQSSIDPKASLSSKIGDGHVFIFNHGSVVFWNVPAEVQQEELNQLLGLGPVPTLKPISDTFVVQEQAGPVQVEFNRLIIDRLNPDRMEVIASTLAQSTSMEYYESLVEEAWKQVDHMVAAMHRSGTNRWFPGPFNRRIAEALTLRSSVVRVLHLLDKPDLIWEDRIMDEIYGDLRAMFDLPERFQALEYKLQLIQQTLEVLVEATRDRRLYWLELTIVLLILFEIIMTFVK